MSSDWTIWCDNDFLNKNTYILYRIIDFGELYFIAVRFLKEVK